MLMLAAVVIICLEPIGRDVLHLVNAVQDAEVQPFVADSAIVSLYIGVLWGLSGLNMV